ncbi:TIGR00341 family protein [Leptolyngbya cf. ectocarpi LEGE 11479]|uniref:TIGR00341 family protein n=1 Tax=Leptolyngbya cf. ectocarpi LEGE 11479 TaxID=1828722 RepID=A0A929F8P6_LEPEC|nr:TIGR00341 family protein [Leptolyngbya ectocarpi]MBE9069425.1 TIGR00341 family protein [Leptolyngbya cf. ectocarpi LEGE 11479]
MSNKRPSDVKTPKGSTFKRRSPLALLRYYAPPFVYTPAIRAYRQLSAIWNINSGDWHWLEGKPVSLKALNRDLWRSAEPSSNYITLLFLSGVISTMGLLAGSTATIIGAMIVAPLMGPITCIAFSLSVGNRRLLKRSGMSLLLGCLLTVLTAYLFASTFDLNNLNPEITSRIRPTLIDLVIALAAGAAGAFAKTRRGVADALPGVAIAVALVPPLSVIGIGLALPSDTVTFGSTILFLTNLVGIIFSGVLVFVWQEYGSLTRAKGGLVVAAFTLTGLAIPLGFSLRELVIEAKTRSLVSNLIRRRTVTFSQTDIRRLQVDAEDGNLRISLEVAAPMQSITDNQIDLVHSFLEAQLERPIGLDVRIIPVEFYQINPAEPQEQPDNISPTKLEEH